jgi:uncharacterized RDD family membrane protein YckC
MTYQSGYTPPPQPTSFNAPIPTALLAGVRTRRVVAIILDLVLVALISTAVFLMLGFVTLGLAWFFLPPMFPIVAFFYNGLTVSGARQATPGMKAMDLQMRTMNGEPVSFLVAAVHAVLYYVSITIFAPILLISLIASDKRCLHDMLAGVIVVRRVD